MTEEEKSLRTAKIISLALFSLKYDLKNGVVFEEATEELAANYDISLTPDTTHVMLLLEVEKLFEEFKETIE